MKFETLHGCYLSEGLRVIVGVCDLDAHQVRDVVGVDDRILILVPARLQGPQSERVVQERYLDDRELIDHNLEHALQVQLLILCHLIDVRQEVVLDDVEGATEGS